MHNWKLMTCVALLGLILSGCGDSDKKPWPVTGTVKFQGNPISGGVIRFSNPQGRVDMMADIQGDGTYKVVMAGGDGLPAGTYQVAIMPPRQDLPTDPMKALPQRQQHREIPMNYRQPSTSGLTLTVKQGEENRFDVDMFP